MIIFSFFIFYSYRKNLFSQNKSRIKIKCHTCVVIWMYTVYTDRAVVPLMFVGLQLQLKAVNIISLLTNKNISYKVLYSYYIRVANIIFKKFQNNSRTFPHSSINISRTFSHFSITFQEHMDGQDEIIFSHKWEIQTGDNWKCCNLRSPSSKILISRTSQKKWLFSSTFTEQFKEFQNRWPPCICSKYI